MRDWGEGEGERENDQVGWETLLIDPRSLQHLNQSQNISNMSYLALFHFDQNNAGLKAFAYAGCSTKKFMPCLYGVNAAQKTLLSILPRPSRTGPAHHFFYSTVLHSVPALISTIIMHLFLHLINVVSH